MTNNVKIALLEPKNNTWSKDIDHLRELLGAPNNPNLFPPHYLKAVFPKIGGRAVVLEEDNNLVAVGFLFARSFHAGIHEYTLRLHRINLDSKVSQEQIISKIERCLKGNKVVFYDPLNEQQYSKTTQQIAKVDVGRPDAAEALSIRELQQKIWGYRPQQDKDFLYPSDIHSTGFHPGTSFVARINGEIVGFIFGFYKLGGSQLPKAWSQNFHYDFRIESQLTGVLEKYQGYGIGTILKKVQAEKARREGIDIINWTVDPLQYANARVNFGKLKAVAFDYYPNHYLFRNGLNQVTASRFGITWLINTDRVKQALTIAESKTTQSLRRNNTIQRLDRDSTKFQPYNNAKMIAIEVPTNWTNLQKESFSEASRWRERTDIFFQQHLGCEEGKYIITDIGEDGDRKYLIAERVDSTLLERLSV